MGVHSWLALRHRDQPALVVYIGLHILAASLALLKITHVHKLANRMLSESKRLTVRVLWRMRRLVYP